MAIIATIGRVPLFTTVQEALAWARANGLSGYHTHNWQGQLGYMGGTTHTAATGRSTITRSTSQTTTQRPTVARPIPRDNSPGGGGGGGGY